MNYSIYHPFNEINIDDFFKEVKKTICNEIISNPKEYIIGVDKMDYVNYLTSKYSIDELKIDFNSEEVELLKEIEREKVNEWYGQERVKYTEYVFCIKYIYTGLAKILQLHPSNNYRWTIGGSGKISNIDVRDNYIVLFFSIFKQDKAEFNRVKEGTIKKTFENLDNTLWYVQNFNNSLSNYVEKEFDKIRLKYEQDNNFFKELNIGYTNKKSNTYEIPIIQKRVNAPSIKQNDKPSPQLEMTIYKQILNTIYNIYKGFERLPNNYRNKDEEALRDGLLPSLQTIYGSYSSSGETFNKEGKTDICIKESGGGNVFVAECKIWKGEKLFLDAINQLLDRYVTWRDTKTALIVFVKNDSFSEIVEKAKSAILGHEYFVRSNGSIGETSFSYVFNLPNDKNRIIYLELMMFHFQ